MPLKLVVSGLRVVVSVVDPSVAGSKSGSVVGGWPLNQLRVAGTLESMLMLGTEVRSVQGCSSHHCDDHQQETLLPWVLERQE